MPISEVHVGRSYPATSAYEITAVKVAEFAAALGDADNPAYRGADAVAPPTFAVVLAAATWDSLFGDPELALSLSRTVHADQRFTWERHLRVGDLVQAQLRIDKVRLRGAAAFITISVQLSTTADEPLCVATSTLVHTAEVAA
jgi:hypothetical protein